MIILRNAALGLGASLAATLAFAMPAHASTSQVTFVPVDASADETLPTVLVRYGDLDLASTQGRAILHKRVDAAIKQVCTAVADQYEPLKANAAFARCREEVGDVTATRVASVLGQMRLAQH